MSDAVRWFPEWMHKVAFAGRRNKSYKLAQDALQSKGIEVVAWGGAAKDCPDVLLLDDDTARNPPKKVATMRKCGKKIVNVKWLVDMVRKNQPLEWDTYDMTDFEPESESDSDGDISLNSATDSEESEFTSDDESLESASSPEQPQHTYRRRAFRTAAVENDDSDIEDTVEEAREVAHTAALRDVGVRNVDAPWWERTGPADPSKPQWVGAGFNNTAPKERKRSIPNHTIHVPTRTRTRSRSQVRKVPEPPVSAVSLSSSLKSNGSATSNPGNVVRGRRQSLSKDAHAHAPTSHTQVHSNPQAHQTPAPQTRPPPKRTFSTNRKPAEPKSAVLEKADQKRKTRDRPWLHNSVLEQKETKEEQVDHIMKTLKEHEATRHLPQDIIQGIRNEILDVHTLRENGITFDDVHGLEEAKKTLHRSVILPRKNPKLFRGLRKPAKGLLLFGPPGNGKTMLAKAVAAQCELTFFNISASVLTSKMVGDGEKNVKALFACARALAPSFVFLDEIDSLLTTRGGGGSEHEASRRLKTEFLVQLDGAGAVNDNILVMAATNRPMDLDDAVLRRLEKRVFVPLPSDETRLQYCKRALEHDENLNLAFSEHTWQLLANETKDYSFCDLANLVRELALAPLDDCADLMEADVSDLRPINESDVRRQVKKIRKSVSDDLLRQLLAWNEHYGSQAD